MKKLLLTITIIGLLSPIVLAGEIPGSTGPKPPPPPPENIIVRIIKKLFG